MVVSDNLIFQHIPKTGGSSVREYMIKALPNTHVYERESGTFNPHTSLDTAFEFAKSVGSTAKRVFCVFRNPYAVEVSMYFYARQYPEKAGSTANHVVLANSGDFTNYLQHNKTWPSFEYYLQTGSRIYEDITILKMEEDFPGCVKRIVYAAGGNPNIEFPHINPTIHDPFMSYYSPQTEEIVYRKYKWVFDKGYYSRGIV